MLLEKLDTGDIRVPSTIPDVKEQLKLLEALYKAQIATRDAKLIKEQQEAVMKEEQFLQSELEDLAGLPCPVCGGVLQ